MTLLKYGLIAAAVLGFASFVYYRVQTIPEAPKLEISFGKAGAEGTPLQATPQGPFFKGKVSKGAEATAAAQE